MNQLKDPESDLSIKINTATEIYTLKKPFLIKYCENKKLKSTGTTSELRARLSRYLKGTITLDDIDNTLSKEECNLVLIKAKANKIDFDKLEKEAGIIDSSDSSPDTSKINKLTSDSFLEISKDNLRLYDNLNASTSSFVNKTENILKNSNITYQNCKTESSETYENILKNLKINDTSNNTYEELNFNNQPENSEIIESKLINLNNPTNIIDSNNTSKKPKFENENTAIIINNQKGDNLNSEIHSISLNKQTQIMTDKILMIKPDHFSGNEDVRKYFKQYEKAADVNGWKDEDKVRFLSVFVKGTASTFLENLEDKHNNWTWNNLKQEFLDEFQPIGYNTILKSKLENRRQGDTESIMSFVTEIENICRQLNKNMNEDEICTYILKGLKETVLHAISLHDNSNLKALKKNLKKFELMQFRINNRGPELSDYTEILNEHVSQLNQKTREKGKEIDDLKRQLIERDREYRKEINQLRENIQQINITEKKNRFVNFDDEEINNRYNNNNYNYNEDRSRSYKKETNHQGRQREYRDKSPYPEKFNYRSRESSRNRQYGRDRSLSRERDYYNKIPNENNTNQDYERKPSYKYVSNNYEYRDNSRNRESSLKTDHGRNYRNRSHSRDRDDNRNYNYSYRHQYSREHSREKTPERYRGDRYNKESERVTCYRCNEKGHYADRCTNTKN